MILMSTRGTQSVIEDLLTAVNAHNLNAIVECFAKDYVNETPAHPSRGFRGRDQVRQNWQTILRGVPGVQARILRSCFRDDEAWTEWEMSGLRNDGGLFQLRGVVIFGIRQGSIFTARFYMEPVERGSPDINAATSRLVGSAPVQGEETTT